MANLYCYHYTVRRPHAIASIYYVYMLLQRLNCICEGFVFVGSVYDASESWFYKNGQFQRYMRLIETYSILMRAAPFLEESHYCALRH